MTTDTAMVEQLEVVALVKLAQLNVPTDVQEFLVQGNPMAGVAPHALRSAIRAVLECLRTPTPEMVEAGNIPGWDDVVTVGQAEVVWQAMIDRALNPSTGEVE